MYQGMVPEWDSVGSSVTLKCLTLYCITHTIVVVRLMTCFLSDISCSRFCLSGHSSNDVIKSTLTYHRTWSHHLSLHNLHQPKTYIEFSSQFFKNVCPTYTTHILSGVLTEVQRTGLVDFSISRWLTLPFPISHPSGKPLQTPSVVQTLRMFCRSTIPTHSSTPGLKSLQ